MHDIFLSGGAANGIACWDIQSNTVINQYNASFGQVQSLEFINDGKAFVSSADVVKRNSSDKAIMVWDFETVR
jgi:WD40 repeat protein